MMTWWKILNFDVADHIFLVPSVNEQQAVDEEDNTRDRNLMNHHAEKR